MTYGSSIKLRFRKCRVKENQSKRCFIWVSLAHKGFQAAVRGDHRHFLTTLFALILSLLTIHCTWGKDTYFVQALECKTTSMATLTRKSRFILFAWLTLGVTIIVILWGDVVQATGSGDGCGAYWPVCNGEVLPAFAGRETFIEFTHRVTSGFVGIMSLVLFIWSRMSFSRGSLVRRGAAFTLFFMFTESLVGAVLVVFRLVGEDASMARVVIAPLHLLNTLLLIAALVLTLYFAYGGNRPSWKGQGNMAWLLACGMFLIGVVSAMGAITSLGDAIFPVASTEEAIRRSVTEGEHFLVRLRVWHPVVSIFAGIYLIVASWMIHRVKGGNFIQAMGIGVFAVFVLQMIVGTLNVITAASLTTQLIHILLADGLWSFWVLLAASALAIKPAGSSDSGRLQNLQASSATD